MLLLALSVLSAASLGAHAQCPFVSRPAAAEPVYYDTHDGTVLTDAQLSTYEQAGVAFYCVNKFPDCNETEGRRTDGSCNNLQYPAAGAGHTPFRRILPSVFTGDSSGYAVRLAENGSLLPGPRHLRTKMLATGQVAGDVYTQLMMFFFVFTATDIAAQSIHDTFNYVRRTPPCCSVAGAADPVCANIDVPADDPVHSFNGLRCMNMTWPISFQSSGCISNSTQPERINYGTPFHDLSVLYGNDDATVTQQRLFSGGLLNYTLTSSNRQWPYYNTAIPNNSTSDGIAGLTGVNFIFGLFMWREHNRIAAALADINPCWDDEQLFTTAREILIAINQQIVYYELYGPLMGTDNLIESGVLSDDSSFRDVYDEAVKPELTLEALTSLRWVHTMQEGALKLMNADGEIVGEFLEVNLFGTDLTTSQSNIQYFSQGAFRQSTGAVDGIFDPTVGNRVLGASQFSSDVGSSDVAKGRLFGLAPYTDYLEYCTGNAISSFDDLSDAGIFTDEYLERLKEQYTSPGDIDLIVALWGEALVDGGRVPQTLYCLVTEQLVRSVVADRHWFERDSRPNSLTEAQLAEIRKASVARIMCDNADTVVEIQPRAFQVISTDNPLTDCSDIPSIDLTAWTDDSSFADIDTTSTE